MDHRGPVQAGRIEVVRRLDIGDALDHAETLAKGHIPQRLVVVVEDVFPGQREVEHPGTVVEMLLGLLLHLENLIERRHRSVTAGQRTRHGIRDRVWEVGVPIDVAAAVLVGIGAGDQKLGLFGTTTGAQLDGRHV